MGAPESAPKLMWKLGRGVLYLISEPLHICILKILAQRNVHKLTRETTQTSFVA